MGFRFHIIKVWQFEKVPQFLVTGLLEEGKIIPPVTAQVFEHDGQTVQIESIALGRGKPMTGKPEELTLVAGRMTMQPQFLEECHLVDGALL